MYIDRIFDDNFHPRFEVFDNFLFHNLRPDSVKDACTLICTFSIRTQVIDALFRSVEKVMASTSVLHKELNRNLTILLSSVSIPILRCLDAPFKLTTIVKTMEILSPINKNGSKRIKKIK